MSLRVHIPILDRWLHIFKTPEEVEAFSSSNFRDTIEVEEDTIAQCNEGTTRDTGAKRACLTINPKRWKEEKDLNKQCILAHECVHLAVMLMNQTGIDVDEDNDEILAHLVEYLYKTIYKKL